jgi:meso-butanediol dehydrogenase/(S,S)-butanediol dehydrogenase/diacetyl reductase
MRLQGKVAVVTGGGAGIGRGIVLCMAKEGADIAIPDIQDANAQAVVKEVLAMGRKAISMRCDVTKGATWRPPWAASRRRWAGSTSW